MASFCSCGPWGQPIGRTTVYDAFKKVCAATGIKNFRFHDVRHSFGSHLVMAGADLVTVKELMGHKNLSTTQRYLHLAREHKAQAVKKLADRLDATMEAPSKQAAVGAEPAPKLEQNRNIFLVRRGRGLGLLNEDKRLLEAAGGFEPPHRGFADLSLNHLGTPPFGSV